MSYVWFGVGCGLPSAGVARASLDEYRLTLLLHHHAHNYGAAIADPEPTPVPGLIRRAERHMLDHAMEAITVSTVADELGVSVRSL